MKDTVNETDSSELFVTIPRVNCKNPDQLMNSKGIRSFLAMFNSDRETGDPVSAESIQGSFRDFERAREYFEQFKVQGSPRDVQKLMRMIDEMGDRVKRVDTEYKLPESEVVERFSKLGIDLPKVHKEWAGYYQKAGYGKALIENEVMERNERYSLPMPQLCEAEMQAFEAEFPFHKDMEIMVDDARLTPSETFNFLQKNRTKSDAITSVRLVQALPVDPEMVRKYIEENGIPKDKIDPVKILQQLHKEKLKEYEEKIPRGVRLVSYDPTGKFAYWGIGNSEKGFMKESEGVKRAAKFMDIGTYMRLCKYWAKNSLKSALWRFQNYDNAQEQGYVPLKTMTANVAPDGNVFAIEYNSEARRFMIEKISPTGEESSTADIVREVVQTEI